MQDRTKIDKEEAFGNKIETILKTPILKSIYEDKPTSGIIKLTDWVKDFMLKIQDADLGYDQAVKFVDNLTIVFDTSIEISGPFIAFCEENKFDIQNLITEAVSVLTYSDKDFDPFVLHGCYKITISKDFYFIKSSLLYQAAQNTDNVSSFIVVDKENYNKFVEIKNKFIKWQRQRSGTIVKIIGGDDYAQATDNKWDDLFFGEKEELKKDLKKTIDDFFASKEYYKENNIPWHLFVFVDGPAGSGKTSLINTILSEYDVEPITLNYYNTDDSVINVLFKATENQHKGFIFIDNIDDYLDSLVTPEYLHELMSNYQANDGNIVLFTCKKVPEIFKDAPLNFDTFVSIGAPEYNNSLNLLFSKYITAAHLKDLQKICQVNNFSYSDLYKIYKSFIKKIKGKQVTKKKDLYSDLQEILTNLLKENDKLIKSKSKKIGLLNKK